MRDGGHDIGVREGDQRGQTADNKIGLAASIRLRRQHGVLSRTSKVHAAVRSKLRRRLAQIVKVAEQTPVENEVIGD